MTFPHWTLCAPILLASNLQAETWPLDKVDGTMIIHGEANTAAGALAQSLVLDGSSVIELKDRRTQSDLVRFSNRIPQAQPSATPLPSTMTLRLSKGKAK